jgi:hypothetical protein
MGSLPLGSHLSMLKIKSSNASESEPKLPKRALAWSTISGTAGGRLNLMSTIVGTAL